jgi:hypothetical protein
MVGAVPGPEGEPDVPCLRLLLFHPFKDDGTFDGFKLISAWLLCGLPLALVLGIPLLIFLGLTKDHLKGTVRPGHTWVEQYQPGLYWVELTLFASKFVIAAASGSIPLPAAPTTPHRDSLVKVRHRRRLRCAMGVCLRCPCGPAIKYISGVLPERATLDGAAPPVPMWPRSVHRRGPPDERARLAVPSPRSTGD